MTPLIETRGLTKRFDGANVVDNLDWSVDGGSVFGLLGPNGAGKTTTLKMLLGMVRPTAGTAHVAGINVARDPESIREIAAFVPEEKRLYPRMKISEFLAFYGSYFPRWRPRPVTRLLKEWGVDTGKRIGALSKGQRAKLVLAAAFGRQPRILLLDEPTVDLDPASVDEVLSILTRWTADGEHSAVVATHRLDEVERICDSVGAMLDGRLLLTGNLDDLRSEWRRIEVIGQVPREALNRIEAVRQVDIGNRHASILVDRNASDAVAKLSSADGLTVEVHPVTLREMYLAAVQHERGRLDDVLEDLV